MKRLMKCLFSARKPKIEPREWASNNSTGGDIGSMEGIITLVSKDNQRICVPKPLLMEMSKLMMMLLSYEGENTRESDENQEICIPEFSGTILRVVVDYMQKKKEKGGQLDLDDLPIDEAILFDVLAAAAYFQCYSV